MTVSAVRMRGNRNLERREFAGLCDLLRQHGHLAGRPTRVKVCSSDIPPHTVVVLTGENRFHIEDCLSDPPNSNKAAAGVFAAAAAATTTTTAAATPAALNFQFIVKLKTE